MMKTPMLPLFHRAVCWATACFCLAHGVARAANAELVRAPQWQEVELTFTATHDVADPDTDTEGWAEFTHEDGSKIR